MLLKWWRSLHMILAMVASLFLLLSTVSGLVLSLEPIHKYKSLDAQSQIRDYTLDDLIQSVKMEYEEPIDLSIEDDKYVKITAISMEPDKDGTFYIDPSSGKKIADKYASHPIFEWMTGFHRSLFLKTTGRIFIGISALLLFLIAVTGLALLIKKLTWRKFFLPFENSDQHPYYHSYFGRLFLLPICLIALSAVILAMIRFSIIEKGETYTKPDPVTDISITEGSIFKQIRLNELRLLEFPFSSDEEDYFILELKDRILEVNQISGRVISVEYFPFTRLLNSLSFDIHTGISSNLWCIVLFISCISILYFMYSGFLISYKRLTSKRKKNLYLKEEATSIILVGSENGSTWNFAKLLAQSLEKAAEPFYIESLNDYSSYPKAKDLLILSSTYGEGEAPSNADRFIEKLQSVQQQNTLHYSIVGFGSQDYPKFCQFALDVNNVLENKEAFRQRSKLALIDKAHFPDFQKWMQSWSKDTNIHIDIPNKLDLGEEKQESYLILDKQIALDGYSSSFLLELKSKNQRKHKSGDLLAIRVSDNEEARLYSVGKNERGNIILVIKKHDFGLCSTYLSKMEVGQSFKAIHRINTSFHLAPDAKGLIMIANGTGIAPFIGMNAGKNKLQDIHLLWGKRNKKSFSYLNEDRILGKKKPNIAYHYHESRSREEGGYTYVQDILKSRAKEYLEAMDKQTVIMVCGSLAMYKDILKVLQDANQEIGQKPFQWYLDNNKIRSDCY